MEIENLKFDISLSGTVWKKLPAFSIWFDEQLMISGEADSSTKTFTFEREVSEGDHVLKIRLDNKTDDDTLLENNNIINDMLLNIDDITIDDISLGNLLWSAEYILDTPCMYKGEMINHLDSCINLGWNGAYTLKFTSPFYIWLLEKI